MSDYKLPTEISCYELPATFNSRIGSELIELLLSRRGSDYQVSGAEVRRFGGQYLQVLLAAHAAWKADGHIFRICPMSEELISGLALLGVSPELFFYQKDYVA